MVANWCLPEAPMIVHIYADRRFIQAVIEDLQIRNVEYAFPAERYRIVP